ncbi:hypothetical protein, partial [Mycobacterium sp.]|uniref:hypothetical protein n=1 Tax=Mycobacterium sp. TaxID=1785 RepID=UPI003F99E460
MPTKRMNANRSGSEATSQTPGDQDPTTATCGNPTLTLTRGYSEHAGHEQAEHLRRRSFMVSQYLTQTDWQTGDVVDKVAA